MEKNPRIGGELEQKYENKWSKVEKNPIIVQKREQKGAFETESGIKVENVGKGEPSGPEM